MHKNFCYCGEIFTIKLFIVTYSTFWSHFTSYPWKKILSWFMRYFNLFNHLILMDFTKVTCLFSIQNLVIKDLLDLKMHKIYLEGKNLMSSYHLYQKISGQTSWKSHEPREYRFYYWKILPEPGIFYFRTLCAGVSFISHTQWALSTLQWVDGSTQGSN